MTLEKTLRGIVLAGIFAIPFIPLIVSQSMFFPFITGKNFTFRIVVEVITFAWLALMVVDVRYRPRKSWLWAALAIFVLVIGVADLFGANPAKSIWSNYERMEGWVTLAHLLAYVTVMYAMLTTEVLWRSLMHTSIGVSVLVGFYGLLQLAGFVTINQGGVRLDATFGNATYLAVYMLFHLFLTALMWEGSWRTASRRVSVSALYGGIMLLQAVALFFTATRGAIIGLLGGAALSALLLVVFARNSKNAWRAAIGVVAGIAILVGLFFALKNTSVVQSVEPLRRLAEISTTERTVSARFMNWNMAWQGVKERPILGWGQENYNLVFNKYYNPRMYNQEPWFDRVHNVVFDWLIAGGFLGFAAYVSIFLFALFGLWRSGAFSVSEASLMTGLLAGYAFHNLFVFDNVTSYLLFGIVLSFIMYRVALVKGSAPIVAFPGPQKLLPVLAVVSVFALWGVAWGVNGAAFAANKTLIQGLIPRQDLNENIAYFEKALSYDAPTANQEIREQIIQAASRARNLQIDPAVKGKLFEMANAQMAKQMTESPLDARFPFFLAILNDSYGAYDAGKAYIEQAQVLSPGKQAIRFQAGVNATLRGDTKSALNIFKEAFELEPSYDEARALYATAAVKAGDSALGKTVAAPLLEKGVADQRLIGAYVDRGDYRGVMEVWAARVAKFPDDAQARFALAASYYAMRDVAAAIRTLEEAGRDIPDAKAQADTFIKEIRNGTIQVSR